MINLLTIQNLIKRIGLRSMAGPVLIVMILAMMVLPLCGVLVTLHTALTLTEDLFGWRSMTVASHNVFYSRNTRGSQSASSGNNSMSSSPITCNTMNCAIPA